MKRQKHLTLAVLASLIIAPTSSLACSIASPNGGPFQPDMETFRKDLTEYRRNNGSEEFPLMPAPLVEVVSVARATRPEDCNYGHVKVRVTWPKSAPYRLKNLAFYFRVVEGSIPGDFGLDIRLPFVRDLEENNTFETYLAWHEYPPDQQKPLNFTLEVFAINKALEIGQSARIQVR